jgi:SpoVK/Ycf46/Vps4 family AAA+-type ATPase
MSDSNFSLSPVTTVQSLPTHKNIDINFMLAVATNFFNTRFNNGKNVYTCNLYLKGKIFGREDKTETVLKIENFIGSLIDTPKQVLSHTTDCCVFLLFDELLVRFYAHDNFNCLNVNITGEKDEVEKFSAIILEYFEQFEFLEAKKVPIVHWCFFDVDGRMTALKRELIVENVPFTEMYPFLQGESLEDYYERFDKSNASILLLQGPPGTGKTSFIRGLLAHFNKQALLSYEEAILKSDTFLSTFVKNEGVDYLIFEDADAFLTSRESGNRTIHKFLNAGDGLISASNKKIIFTTNLQSLTDIDPALIRPGRCFDILQFRPLTKDEAITVAQKRGVDVELPEQNFTVAEIFNTQKYTKKKETRSIGFAM